MVRSIIFCVSIGRNDGHFYFHSGLRTAPVLYDGDQVAAVAMAPSKDVGFVLDILYYK